MLTMFSSSNPEGRFILARASTIMATQLVTMASVSAMSATMRPARTLLRRSARTMGPISMIPSVAFTRALLQLQVHGRGGAAHPPGGIDAGHQARHQRQPDGRRQHGAVEAEEGVALRPR